jgi:hypothetical protein
MTSSDRRIVAARKIEEPAPPPPKADTWPAPPPSGSEGALDDDERDTIPTPAPESGVSDVVVVPPLRELDLGLDEEIE